jgi:hypothetical protein
LSTAEALAPNGHPFACACTECALVRALDHATPAEPAAYTSPEQTGVADAIAELAALRGVELPAGIVHRCKCGTEVHIRSELCAGCAAEARLAVRQMVLAKAWRSLPDWPHAEIGPTCPAHRDLLAAVATWGRAKGHVLLLGRTGAGKSTSAVAGAKRILRRAEANDLPADEMAFAVGLRFVAAPDLVADVKNHPLGSKAEAPLFQKAERASLLILDEVGFEPVDPNHRTVARLLERRYNTASKRTWVTSGLTADQFADRYGVALGRKMGIDEPTLGVVVQVFPESA